MYVQLRLYTAHDYDLIALDSLPYIKLDDVIHACVCAFVRHEEFILPVTMPLPQNRELRDRRICVTFDDEKDADVVAWLKSVIGGFRSSALKNITRSFVTKDYLSTLYCDELVDSQNNNINYGNNISYGKNISNSKAAKKTTVPARTAPYAPAQTPIVNRENAVQTPPIVNTALSAAEPIRERSALHQEQVSSSQTAANAANTEASEPAEDNAPVASPFFDTIADMMNSF